MADVHDSRRYHRMRRPTFTRAYGALTALLGDSVAGATAGAATGAAEGGLGSTLVGGLEAAAGPALTGIAKTAVGGIESLGQGLQSLFGGTGGGEAGYLQSLGQAVPEGVELAGPSSTFTGPGFLGSVAQGFVHGPQQFANPSAATSIGQGVGGLMKALEQLQQQGGGPAKMPQLPPGQIIRPPQFMPQPRPVVPALTGFESRAQAPIMALLHI